MKGRVFFSHADLQEKKQIFDLLKRIIHHVRDCTTSILWCIHLINACKPLHETPCHAIFRQSSRKRQDVVWRSFSDELGCHRPTMGLLELGNEKRRASLQWGHSALKLADLGNDRELLCLVCVESQNFL